MDILKKNIFASFITIVTLNIMNAQNDTLREAFNSSYKLECQGEYAKATEVLKNVYDEKSYEINLRAGWLNYKAALYIESQNYYKKAIALKPNSLEAKFGYIYPTFELGNMDQVIAQYIKILDIDPQNTTANYRLGLFYYDNKEYATAYNYFEKIVALYPFDYDGLLMYAWSNLQTGKMDDAKVLFNKVLLLSPYDKSALEGLGLIK